MAKAISSIAMSLSFLFTLTLLIFSISVASGFSFEAPPSQSKASLQCNVVHGVTSGDTCFAIAQAFKLSTNIFNFINPNLNCSDLFVGQWVCIHGFLS